MLNLLRIGCKAMKQLLISLQDRSPAGSDRSNDEVRKIVIVNSYRSRSKERSRSRSPSVRKSKRKYSRSRYVYISIYCIFIELIQLLRNCTIQKHLVKIV